MKLLNYFIAFNAFAIAYFVFNQILLDPYTDVEAYTISCLIFSSLGSVAVYNFIEGYNRQK